MLTTNTTAVLAPTYSSPTKVNYGMSNPQDSPRYYDNTPSGGQLLYSNPQFSNTGGVAYAPTATYAPTTTAY